MGVIMKRIWLWIFGDSVVVHVALILILMGVAGNFLLPFGTFDSSTGYRWFKENWPRDEIGWGVLLGCFAWFGVVGFFARNRWVKLVCVMFLGTGHLLLAEGAYRSNHLSTGTTTYGILALLAVWLIVKIGMEEKLT
jgi:hypothetical protein